MKTIKRWRQDTEDKRRGPIKAPSNKLTEKEREEIVKIATAKEFMDLPPSQIVPRLADQGRYIASEASFYRVLKEKELLAHRGKTKSPKSNRPKPLVATTANQIYSWDITYLKGPIAGEFFYLYMFMDIWSRKIVGFEIHEDEAMEKSSILIEKICKEEGVKQDQLVLHADNGGAMKGATMLATLQRLGVVPSFSRPRVSDDNPYSESLFKTMKYCPRYPDRPFESLDAAKAWVTKFVDWYNNDHLHSGIKFVTPADRHAGRDKEILENRKLVYIKAKNRNPVRWSKEIKNLDWQEKVYLNYLQKEKEVNIKMAS